MFKIGCCFAIVIALLLARVDVGASTDVCDEHAPGWSSTPDRLVECGEKFLPVEKPEVTIRFFNRAIEIEPDNVRALRGKGQCHLGLHQFKEAAECLRKAVKAQPDWAEALAALGAALHGWAAKNRTKEPRCVIRDRIAEGRTSGLCFSELRESLQSYEKAADEFLKRASTAQVQARKNLCESDEPTAAPEKDDIEQWEKAAALQRKGLDCLLSAADVAFEMGRDDSALSLCEKVRGAASNMSANLDIVAGTTSDTSQQERLQKESRGTIKYRVKATAAMDGFHSDLFRIEKERLGYFLHQVAENVIKTRVQEAQDRRRREMDAREIRGKIKEVKAARVSTTRKRRGNSSRGSQKPKEIRVIRSVSNAPAFIAPDTLSIDSWRTALDKIANCYRESDWGKVTADFAVAKGYLTHDRITSEGRRRVVPEQIGNLLLGTSAFRIAEHRFQLGEFARAARFYATAVSFSDGNSLRHLSEQAQARLGELFGRAGAYDQAVELQEQALSEALRRHDPVTAARVRVSLADLHRRLGQDVKAHQLLKAAICDLEAARELLTLSQAYMEMGTLILDRLGHDPLDMLNLQPVLDSKGKKHTILDGQMMAEDAAYYMRAARKIGGQAFLIGHENNDAYLVAVSLNIFQRDAFSDLDNAHQDRVETLARILGKLELSGWTYLRQGRYKEALGAFAELRDKNKDPWDLDLQVSCLTGVGEAHEGLNQVAEAATAYGTAVKCLERVRATQSHEFKKRFLSSRSGGCYRVDCYKGLVRVLAKSGMAAEALDKSENIKARGLAEDLATRFLKLPPDTPASVLDHDKEIKQKMRRLSREAAEQLLNEGEDPKALDKKMRDVENEWRDHITTMRERLPILADALHPESIRLTDIDLSPTSWSICYDFSRQGIVIWILQGSRIVKTFVRPLDLPKRNNLMIMARLFHKGVFKPLEEMDSQHRAEVQGAYNDLGKLLLDGVSDVIPVESRVLIVPDGSLHRVPFEALPVYMTKASPPKPATSATKKGKSKDKKRETDKASSNRQSIDTVLVPNQLFGDRYKVTYCQSLRILGLIRKRKEALPSEEKVMLVADPVLDSNDPRKGKITAELLDKVSENRCAGLSRKDATECEARQYGHHRAAWSDRLAEQVWNMYDKKPEILLGSDANKDKVMERLSNPANGYTTIMFCTHGGYPGMATGHFSRTLEAGEVSFDENPHLCLAPGVPSAYLSTRDVIANCRLNADLVAAVACHSAKGSLVGGEGLLGMPYAFLVSGARCTLGTLWAVPAKAASELVRNFFQYIREGKSKSEALAWAKRDIRKIPEWSAPMFWAAFVLVGDEGHDKDSRGTELSTACAEPAKKSRGKTKVAKAESSGNPVDKLRQVDKDLLTACGLGQFDLVKRAVLQGADLKARDAEWQGTPLHWAAHNGSVNVVVFLTAQGAEINTVNRAGWTPLMLAAAGGNSQAARVLVRKGADLQAKSPSGKTAADIAEEKGHTFLLPFLKTK